MVELSVLVWEVSINQFSGIHFYRPRKVWHGAFTYIAVDINKGDTDNWTDLIKRSGSCSLSLYNYEGGRYRNHDHSTNKNKIRILSEALRAEARGSENFGVPLSTSPPLPAKRSLEHCRVLQRQIRSSYLNLERHIPNSAVSRVPLFLGPLGHSRQKVSSSKVSLLPLFEVPLSAPPPSDSGFVAEV